MDWKGEEGDVVYVSSFVSFECDASNPCEVSALHTHETVNGDRVGNKF